MNQRHTSQNSKTLDAKFYNSLEIYQLETERIFERHWLCVGRLSEVAQPGDYFLRELNGESLIVIRGHDGEVRCFYNVCRHRGTRLCEAASGCAGKAIRCSYHGWTYDLTGQLIAAPYMDRANEFDRSAYPLKAVSVATWEGFLFVNLSDSPVPLLESVGPFVGRFSDWTLEELVPSDQLHYVVQANWKVIFQNYNECYHCPRIHPHLNQLSSYDSASNDLDHGPLLGGPMKLAEGVETMSSTGRACGDIFPKLNDKDRRRVYYFSIFPTMFLSPHPDYVLVHRIERITTDSTRVVCDLLFHPSSTTKPEFDPTLAVEFWDQVNRQDWRVCELSQQGIKSRAYEPGPFSNLESIVAAFDHHYLDVLRGDAEETYS